MQSLSPFLPSVDFDEIQSHQFNDCQSLVTFPKEDFTSKQLDFQRITGDYPPCVLQGSILNWSLDSVVNQGLQNQMVPSLESISRNSPGMVPESERRKTNGNNKSAGRRRKRRCNGKEMEESKEVMNDRTRSRRATDSHRVAERVRRERINKKLRVLQALVPGCEKPMGMAATLDEIINYVQSLQNQVEFLSMKLTAANSLYNLCLSMESERTMGAR